VPETILYSEPQVVPWRLFGALFVGTLALCALVFAVSGATLADDWWVFLVAAGSVAVWVTWIWVAMRLTPLRLDAASLRLPWRPPIPLDRIETVRVVEGDELKRIRRELERGTDGLPAGTAAAAAQGVGLAGLYLAQTALVRSMRNDPVLKGLVATSANRSALYLETDPTLGPTHRWLVGTRHPREFGDRLEAALVETRRAGAGVRTGSVLSPP
jgi:hypothetical protein